MKREQREWNVEEVGRLAKLAAAAKDEMRQRLVTCDEVERPHSYAICSCTQGHRNARLVLPAGRGKRGSK